MLFILFEIVCYIIAGIIGFLIISTILLTVFEAIYLIIYPIINIFKRLQLLSLRKVNVSKLDDFENDLNFYFNCDYCGKKISTKKDSCPYCESSYHNNKDYIEMKKKKYEEYLNYLKIQNIELQKDLDNFKKNEKLLSRNSSWFLSNSSYNLDVDYKKHYVKKDVFDFNCDYCGSKITGSSKDGGECSNCGASYANNLELLALEEREKVLNDNNEIYKILQQLKMRMNEENSTKDSLFKEKFERINRKILHIYISCILWVVFLIVVAMMLYTFNFVGTF